MPTPLFATGIARGGTNLMTMLLNAHPNVTLAKDPYLPLFKSLRNAIVTEQKNPCRFENFDPEAPLDEYYYFEDRLAVMRLVQSSDLNVPFNPGEYRQLLEALARRMSLSSPLLVSYLDHLQGEKYKALFQSALNIVELGWKTPTAKWLGFHDNWTVEFFAPLARAFPEARFIILIRDVRSSIASQLRSKDPTLIALTLSFVRNWRKLVAFARHYQQSELFDGRLFVMAYEQLVCDPEQKARELCEFLEVGFTNNMLDTNNFIGPHGGAWIPNSNFEVPQQGIYQDSVDRWRKALPGDVVRLIEFVAGPDLEFAGYALSESNYGPNASWKAYDRLSLDHRQCQGWRTDSRNPEVDFALELLRRRCLKHRTEELGLIGRCFLFPEVYRSLFEGHCLFAPMDRARS